MQKSSYYRYYVLGMLTLVSTINIADRLVVSILLEDIKAEFALSDAQIGILAGLAFSLFYAFMGIPIARFADKTNRKNVTNPTAAPQSAIIVLQMTKAAEIMFFRFVLSASRAIGMPMKA